MARLSLWLSFALALPCAAQPAPDLARILNFEIEQKGGLPTGWTGTAGTVVDDQIVHSGRYSARLERTAPGEGASVMTQMLPVDFGGKTLEMRGYLRTENVTGFVGLWAREDGESPTLAFDNMQRQNLKGTTDWKAYSITIPVHPDARRLYFGVLLAGTGKAWADDLELLVDGKPIWEAPKVQRVETVLESDHEFDSGSHLAPTGLSPAQIDNLATLGKVWGFLKYHHPSVVSGQRHWDYDLFRVLPKVLAAADRPAANRVLLEWTAALGPVAPCQSCAKLDPTDLELRPDLDWLSDQKTLGPELSQSLLAIYANRLRNKQFYVSRAGASNPTFDHELAYAQIRTPDFGFQILALYRFWNIVQYWSPNRDIVGENWHDVLRDFIPRIGLAKAAGEYQRQMMALIALDHDTHANLWSSLAVRPPEGVCRLPVTTRFVEGRAVVVGYAADSAKASGLEIGDVITQLDGVPVKKLVEDWTPYYAASNQPTVLRDIGRSMTRGSCGEMRVAVLREGKEIELKTPRVPTAGIDAQAGVTHDRPGPTLQMLSTDVAYLKLSSIRAEDVPRYIDSARATKGLIIDIRNYPSEFVVFALGNLLADRQTHFVRFTQVDLSNPGAFHWLEGPSLLPRTPHYNGKVVVLVDEVSQSQAEYTTMAFRAVQGTTVIGSTTAGADGNVSQFNLPGGLSSMISGLGVFYPDNRPTQRVGIIPDVEVKPTIEGIRAGRDELLEEAVRRILGSAATKEVIGKMLGK